MKIIPNQKFRHDGQTYEKDQKYDVSDELAVYFKNVGWVGADKKLANQKHGTLSIDSGWAGHESEVKLNGEDRT